MIIVIASTLTLLVLVGFVQEFVSLRRRPRLAAPDVLNEPPLISLIIPARNEAQNIARCLDGALTQRYAPYEVIVIDDASTDATPAILATYAQQYPHLKIIQGALLPVGWMGKPYACQQAARMAQGEWLLFLDADTVPQPDLIAALLTHARRCQFDMLTLFPFLELGSFWERVVLPPFQAIIRATFPFERLNAPDVRPDEVAANGQCILVRQHAYWSIGGHGAVQNAMLEDVRLAQTLRQAGFRTGAVEGISHMRVRMYTSGREVFEGLTKNAVAGFRSGGKRAPWAGCKQFFLILAPQWLAMGAIGLHINAGGLDAWLVTGYALVVWLVALGFWSTLLRQIYALPWIYALFWPFGMICYGMIVVRSLWQIWSGRGVTWKGRKYVGT